MPRLKKHRKTKKKIGTLSRQQYLKAMAKKKRFKKSQKAIKNRRELKHKMLSMGFFVLAITSTLPKQQMITSSQELDLINEYQNPYGSVWFICTGNTCRSAALEVAAFEQGMMISTCGSGVRSPGGEMTMALQNAYHSLKKPNHVLEKAKNHRSQSCLEPRGQPKCSLFKDPNSIFAVVAPKNKLDLENLAEGCDIDKDSLDIRVLADMSSECESVIEDPYNFSQKGIEEEQGRPFTDENRLKQKQVYEDLPEKASRCIKSVAPMFGLV
jgi:hypothetical protein